MIIEQFKDRLEKFEQHYPEAPVEIHGNGEPSAIHIEEKNGHDTIVVQTGSKY